jgi:ABC-2 type transport system ATP-binding protein
MKTFLALKNISKNFSNKTAVANISFAVSQGEVVGFLGPNGAGKTTTMRMLTGFLQASSGEIEILGNIATAQNRADLNRHIGYLPEGAPLYPDMTPFDFLNFLGNVRGLDAKKLQERMDFVIETLSLKQVLHQTIETLSKGYKRRVCLAQAILHDPEILILDEPTDGLDPLQKADVRSLIKKLSPTKAILLSTHILDEVEAICSRALVISAGKIVAEGTSAELRAHDPIARSILLRTQQSALEVSAALLNDSSFARVEIEDPHTCRVALAKNSEISALHNLISKNSWRVLTLFEEPGCLDSAFKNLVSGSFSIKESA